MSLISGTGTKYDFNGLRENLHDKIFNISPEETPFISSVGRTDAKATLVEWQTDSLASAVTTNQQLEGDDFGYTTPAASTRVGNYCQISYKTLILSGTLEAVDKAGRKSELAYQLAKRGAEIKRDMETNALNNVGGNAGGVGTARKMATLGAWIKTNVDKEAGGGNPTYTSGVPAAARTDGTPRTFTETILKAVLQSCWTAGASPKVMMVGAVAKKTLSGFSGIATRNFDISNASPKPTAIIGAADVYVSDWGTVRVIPSRFNRAIDGFALDWDMLALATLRPLHMMELAKTGDAEKRALLVEYTLQVKNEAGLGLAADLA